MGGSEKSYLGGTSSSGGGGCCRSCLRITLAIVNIIVILIGLAVIIVGAWSKINGDKYIDVTDGTKVYEQLPILMIIAGVFVFLLGFVGMVGALFANTIGGRIILGLYGFVLALLIILEFASFITALVEKDKLADSLDSSINSTFSRYNDSQGGYKDTWDALQNALGCCGPYGPDSYDDIDLDPPESCCIDSNNCPPSDNSGFYQEGCVAKVKDKFDAILGVIAAIAAVAIVLKLIGVIFSCFVAIRSPNKGYEVV